MHTKHFQHSMSSSFRAGPDMFLLCRCKVHLGWVLVPARGPLHMPGFMSAPMQHVDGHRLTGVQEAAVLGLSFQSCIYICLQGNSTSLYPCFDSCPGPINNIATASCAVTSPHPLSHTLNILPAVPGCKDVYTSHICVL